LLVFLIIHFGFISGCLSKPENLFSQRVKEDNGENSFFVVGKSGSPGFQDGSANKALFNYPVNGVASGKYLFIADSYNSLIRQVDTQTGKVSTVVGIPGQRGARDGNREVGLLDFPEGIATDGKYLYIADTFNHTIRRFDLEKGILSTLAGQKGEEGYADGKGGEAKFNFPRGVAIIGKAVYVADTINSVIRRIDLQTGIVSTLAGKAGMIGIQDGFAEKVRFYFPYGLTSDGGDLYVADTLNHAIRRVNCETKEVETLVGGKGVGLVDGLGDQAKFNAPFNIATDGKVMFVADTLNNAIRKVDLKSRQVITLFMQAKEGEKSPGVQGLTIDLKGPRGVTFNHHGTLFITDTDNHLIRKMNLNSN
jgi:hypothetical protein